MKKEARGWWCQLGSRGLPQGPVEWEEPPAPPLYGFTKGAGVSEELHLRVGGASRLRYHGPIVTGAVTHDHLGTAAVPKVILIWPLI